MYKDKNEIKNQKKIPPLFQITHKLSFKKIKLKVGRYTGSKWFIHGPKHRNRICRQAWRTTCDNSM